jgi:prepilin-type N-terminal cleavage/methylation domain-containing protein
MSKLLTRNQSGLTIVELIVAMAIVSVIVLGVGESIIQSKKTIRMISQTVDFNTLHVLMRKTLSTPKGCQATLTGVPNPSTIVAGKEMGAPGSGGSDFKTLRNPKGGTIAGDVASGSSYGGPEFDNLTYTFYELGPFNDVFALAAFHIEAKRPVGSFIGGTGRLFAHEYVIVKNNGVGGYTCMSNPYYGSAYGLRSVIDGSGATDVDTGGNAGYIVFRYHGDNTNPPGSSDLYWGTGHVTGPNPSVPDPFGGTPGAFSGGSGGWVSFGAKQF